jgi:4,5-DOPA dioxygenase extradiol
MLLVDNEDGQDYALWGGALGKPKAILVFSAHWETDHLAFGETTDHHQLIYDFYGFPDELYDVQYPAPGAPFLAEAIKKLLNQEVVQTQRGLDHGVYVPFIHMWPMADVPILQMTMPHTYSDRDLFELGQRLAPLRDQEILIIAAGALTHNLRAWNPQLGKQPIEWAKVFDDWVAENLVKKDKNALLDWHSNAPNASQNHPSPEHFRPLLIAAGAGWQDAVTFPTSGFNFGIFSRRSVQFG